MDQGRLSADLSASWGCPGSAGARVATLRPKSGSRCFIRLVEAPVPAGFRPTRTYGWAAFDLTVRYRNLLVAFLAILFVDSFINGPFWVTTERHLFASVLPLLLAGWRPPAALHVDPVASSARST